MKNGFLIIMLLFCLTGMSKLYGQKSVVHLKNGSSVKGEIIEFKQGDYLVIKIFEGHEAKFFFNEISKYKIRSSDSKSYGLPPLGYFNYTSLGLLFTKTNEWDWVQANATVHMINGYRFHEFASAGLGIGLDRYGVTSAFPVYATIRYDVLENRVTPTFNANVGYAWMWESEAYDEWQEFDEVQGGFYWELGAGLRINYKKAALLFNLSYKHQHAEMTLLNSFWWPADDIVVEKHNYRNMAFTVGVEF